MYSFFRRRYSFAASRFRCFVLPSEFATPSLPPAAQDGETFQHVCKGSCAGCKGLDQMGQQGGWEPVCGGRGDGPARLPPLPLPTPPVLAAAAPMPAPMPAPIPPTASGADRC